MNMCLRIQKDEHIYVLQYVEGNEENLYMALIEIGKNEGLNVTLAEMLRLIREITMALQEHRDHRDLTFRVNEK